MTPNQRLEQLAAQLRERFAADGCEVEEGYAEVTLTAPRDGWSEIAPALRDEEAFAFDQLVDVCGVDYAGFGKGEWATAEASSAGFGRGQERDGELDLDSDKRFAVVYHFLSVAHNNRLRVRVYLDPEQPIVDSVVSLWNGCDWFEREAFDMYGIMFSGHPDLRRILTDYGFIGHPMRKDFPLSGQVEMRYDEATRRVIYQPITIEQRPQVPKVVRNEEGPSREAADA